MLATDGRCKTFDAAADGYVRGEGAGVVLLRPLEAALRDGDPVLAVIRGTAVTQDGRTNGITAPGARGQAAAVRSACARAGLDPATLSYLEAHAVGSELGDRVELAALAEVFADGADRQCCALGTLKPNVGHLEHAAGIAGLIKVVLALQHRQLPPTLHLTSPHPLARFEQSARDFAVNFGWHGDAGGIDPADQVAPVRGPIGFSFTADRAGCFLVQIADGNEFRRAFGGESRVNSCVLPPETAGADDCCP